MRIRTDGFRAIAVMALLAATQGCAQVLGLDVEIYSIGGAGGAATTQGGMGGDGGGQGGGGTAGGCVAAADCSDPGNQCLERACVDAQCTSAPVASGTALADQTGGDCQKAVCDGNGAATTEADDTDLPVDGQECTDDVCAAGVPSNPPLAADSACGAGGMLYCDGAGKCVGCTQADQCGSTTGCQAPACNAGTCATVFTAPGTPIPMQITGDCMQVQCDGIGGTKTLLDATDIVSDGKECTEDVCAGGMVTYPNSFSGKACSEDGGTRCDGGGKCVECLAGADCASLVCSVHLCIAASCMDGVKNAMETDADCGGPDCAPCADDKLCLVPTDCTSGICEGSPLRCSPPSCMDADQNGFETDIDCGGNACPECGPLKACDLDTDCVGGSCVGNTCQPTCTDGVQNNQESGIDCGGGSTCGTCGLGSTCTAGTDCTGGTCTSGACAGPDGEPANNTCTGASLVAVPATITPLQLPGLSDQDWFMFKAAAADVGKVVHVVTQGSGSPPCDTVVEVFAGADCAAAVTLGGPSDDQNYSENWLSTPITAAGPFWVQVTYSSFGFSTAPYTLLVTLE